MKTGVMSIGAIGLVACLAGSALAGPIAVDFRGTGLGKAASVTFASGDSSAFSNRNLFVGQLIHRLGTGQTAKDFITYCIDLTQYAGDGMFNLVNLRDAPITSPAPSHKWQLGQGQVDALNALYHARAGDIDTNNEAAAFQAAIWEIAYDYDAGAGVSSIDLSAGRVRISNADGSPLPADVASDFASIVAAIGSGGAPLLGVGHSTFQDQIFVPAPGSIALAGLSMGLIARRRR